MDLPWEEGWGSPVPSQLVLSPISAKHVPKTCIQKLMVALASPKAIGAGPRAALGAGGRTGGDITQL